MLVFHNPILTKTSAHHILPFLGTDSSSDSGIPGIKRDKLYCVCKQKYDATKFYVGCDICSNWFHGSCVKITPKMSKKMSE